MQAVQYSSTLIKSFDDGSVSKNALLEDDCLELTSADINNGSSFDQNENSHASNGVEVDSILEMVTNDNPVSVDTNSNCDVDIKSHCDVEEKSNKQELTCCSQEFRDHMPVVIAKSRRKRKNEMKPKIELPGKFISGLNIENLKMKDLKLEEIDCRKFTPTLIASFELSSEEEEEKLTNLKKLRRKRKSKRTRNIPHATNKTPLIPENHVDEVIGSSVDVDEDCGSSVDPVNIELSISKNDTCLKSSTESCDEAIKPQMTVAFEPVIERLTDVLNASKPKSSTSQKPRFIYGNYNRYYGYRNPQLETDHRLQLLKSEFFHSKDVLDIGCNIGHVTLTIARDFLPKKIVGMDIDRELINIAKKNVRHYMDEGSDASKSTNWTKSVMFHQVPSIFLTKEGHY